MCGADPAPSISHILDENLDWVSFPDGLYKTAFGSVMMAHSVFEAAREGMDFFVDPFWRGPKPTLETLFTVSLVGGEGRSGYCHLCESRAIWL